MFFLPESVTQNLTLIEDSLTAEFVRDIDKQLKTVQAALKLPRLRLVAETSLGEALQAMRRCWAGVLGPRDRAGWDSCCRGFLCGSGQGGSQTAAPPNMSHCNG